MFLGQFENFDHAVTVYDSYIMSRPVPPDILEVMVDNAQSEEEYQAAVAAELHKLTCAVLDERKRHVKYLLEQWRLYINGGGETPARPQDDIIDDVLKGRPVKKRIKSKKEGAGQL